MGVVQLILGLLLVSAGAAGYMGPGRDLYTSTIGVVPDASLSNGLIIGGWIAVLFGALRTFVFKGAPRKKAVKTASRERVDELFIRAAAAMAAADGKVAGEEIDMMISLTLKFRSRELTPEEALRYAKAGAGDRGKLLAELEKEAALMADPDKEGIMRACLWISMADLMQDGGELETLKAIAAALKLPAEKAEALQKSLTNAARALVAAAAGSAAAA